MVLRINRLRRGSAAHDLDVDGWPERVRTMRQLDSAARWAPSLHFQIMRPAGSRQRMRPASSRSTVFHHRPERSMG